MSGNQFFKKNYELAFKGQFLKTQGMFGDRFLNTG
jgi:hypothetical protein